MHLHYNRNVCVHLSVLSFVPHIVMSVILGFAPVFLFIDEQQKVQRRGERGEKQECGIESKDEARALIKLRFLFNNSSSHNEKTFAEETTQLETYSNYTYGA